MKPIVGMPIVGMIATSLGGWLLATVIVPMPINPDALAGVLGPLVSALANWTIVSRTYASAPDRLTRVMLMAFVVKAMFFGAYLIIAFQRFGLDSMVFVTSFVASFILLHLIEALSLKRLFADAATAAQV